MALRLRQRDEGGRDEGGYVALLALVLVVTVVAVALLTRTWLNLRGINDKASQIAETGRGINSYTDAIIQLNTTNDLGNSIEETANPLVGQLDTVVGLANSINNKATSITASALTINSTAKTIGNSGSSINTSASGINANLGPVPGIAESIRGGVVTINQNVMTTIGIAEAVRTDVRNILGEANKAVRNGACIDNKTSLGAVNDPDC